jgi:two-component system sensor histidine kinase/response regulator
MDYLNALLPQGYYIQSSPALLWTFATSDSLIALTYFVIGPVLISFALRQPEPKTRRVLLLFAAFILTCGATHLLDMITLWQPVYWLGAFIKAVNAILSIGVLLYAWPRVTAWVNRPGTEQRLKPNTHPAQETAERKQAETDLQAAHDRLKLAADAAELGVWIWTFADNRLIWDERMFKIYGAPESLKTSGLYYEFWQSSLHPDDEAHAVEKLNGAVQGVGPFDPIFRIIRPNGDIRYIQAAGIVERDIDGQPTQMVGTNQDITAQREMETRLHEARETAESASRAKSQFVSNMSHEIRTPMNAVIGLSQLLQDTELSARQHDYLHKILSSSRALLSIINDILDYSKIEAGHLFIDAIDFDLDAVLDNALDLFAVEAEKKGVEIFLDLPTNLPFALRGDPMRLGQVFNNLVGNAVKFTEQGEIRIRVALEPLSGQDIRIEVSVRDSGIGMNEEQQQRLFQAFSQADSSITRKYGGSGLGLIICKNLVELMGGEISVESELGRGSAFHFSAQLQRSDIAFWSRDPGNLFGMRALVVDDQQTSLDVMKNILDSWSFNVSLASSAAEGIDLIIAAERANTPFELLLIDWKMPITDGIELTRKINSLNEKGQIARAPIVIMVTAYGRHNVVEAANTAHYDAVLDKPVKPSTLFDTVARIQNQIRGVAGPSRTHIANDSLFAITRPIHGARVLVVEDIPINQEVAQGLLEKMGLTVDLADNGLEAVKMVEINDYDAVLMDLQMPVMDGFEATRRIHAGERGGNLPIIALTAAALEGDRQEAKAAGMVDHVTKPIEPKKLADALLKHIHPRRQQDGRQPPSTIATTAHARETNKTKPDLSRLSVQLHELKTLLTQRRALARHISQDITVSLTGTQWGEAFAPIETAIWKLRYQDAHDMLSKLLNAMDEDDHD